MASPWLGPVLLVGGVAAALAIAGAARAPATSTGPVGPAAPAAPVPPGPPVRAGDLAAVDATKITGVPAGIDYPVFHVDQVSTTSFSGTLQGSVANDGTLLGLPAGTPTTSGVVPFDAVLGIVKPLAVR